MSGGQVLLIDTFNEAELLMSQFQIRICPALKDKAKAKAEADAKTRAQQEKGETSSELTQSASNDNGNSLTVPLTKETAGEKSSPFEPPYIEDLFVGELEGLEGEEGMVALVSLKITAVGM